MKKMLRLLAAMIGGVATAVVIALAAPSSAVAADTTFIENSPNSRANIVASDWCGGTPWRLGTNRVTLGPGGYSYSKDDGFYVPGGRYFTMWRGKTKVYNNVYSGTGRTVCVSPGAVHVLVV